MYASYVRWLCYYRTMIKCGFATLLEDCPVGYDFTSDNIPLHLTHVDSLQIELPLEEIELKLQKLLANRKAFSVKALKDELYGPNKDIPVTVLELTPELTALHKAIMDMLEREGAVLKNPHFHGKGFEPHVSIYGPRRLPAGEEVLIKDISIGIKTGDGPEAIHQIVATIPFLKV